MPKTFAVDGGAYGGSVEGVGVWDDEGNRNMKFQPTK